MAEESSDERGRRPASDWAQRHLWQIQWVRDILVVLTLFGLLLLGERLSLVTVPFLLALLFAYLFEPLVCRLCGWRGVSRRAAVGGIVVATVLLVVIPVVVGLGFGILQGAAFASGIAKRTSAVIASVDAPDDPALREAVGGGAWLDIRDTFAEWKKPLPPEESEDDVRLLGVERKDLVFGAKWVMSWLRDNADQVAKTVLGSGKGIAKTVLGTGKDALSAAASTVHSVGLFAFSAFLVVFFFFFVSSAWPELSKNAVALMPDEHRDRWMGIVERMDRAVHGFIRGRLTIGFVLGVFYTVGFWLIGVPAPLIAGPAVAILTLVPYAALLLVPVVIVLLWLEGHTGLQGSIWWVIFAPLVLYQIGQLLDDYVLTPLIQGKSTDLDTPTILFASIAGGILLGFFGLLVAIPLAACAKILFIEVLWPRTRAWLQGHEKDFLPLDRGS